MCTRATIKVVNHHQQEYQHQYAREKQSNSLIDVVGEPKVRITIVEDVAAGTKYCKDKHPRDNHDKRSKIDLAKQDLKDHT
jgi:hypothetical protein